ncbi:hypothetical protein QFC21_002023 [Naganishia friedmannii]|uniref:Uncharacterized protein n=1 Tax=Naganishia friedmannii TaxID=89922 RepID=A0ACC2VYW7_9TREE|nr:hypothetical protein QFC21_002023 [Naganishia friedmannii]
MEGSASTTNETHLSSPHELLASELKPVTDATLTIRVIKSFEYRTQKSLILRDLDLTKLTVGELLERCKAEVKTTAGFKAFRTTNFDTLKLYTQAHSHKTMNLIINLDHDDWILDDMSKTLVEVGAVNETEYSLFNREAYEQFKLHPETKWD